MKHIVKGKSPEAFEAWKALANDDWQPSYAELKSPEKQCVHVALLVEQGFVCCYCGRSITAVESHIEHFRPQELRPDLELSFANLFASCIRETTEKMPLSCGHAKKNQFDESLAISPLDPGCERRFIFNLPDGRILPNADSDAGAGYMIDTLQLNINHLRNQRKELLSRTFDPVFINEASEEELASC